MCCSGSELCFVTEALPLIIQSHDKRSSGQRCILHTPPHSRAESHVKDSVHVCLDDTFHLSSTYRTSRFEREALILSRSQLSLQSLLDIEH